MPTNWLDWVKLLGPYVIEILKVVFGGPHKYAVENLKSKGVIS